MTTLQTLPLELIDLVMEACEDGASLKALRLTSHFFETLASPLLFRTVHLEITPESFWRMERLSESDSLRKHVKYLEWNTAMLYYRRVWMQNYELWRHQAIEDGYNHPDLSLSQRRELFSRLTDTQCRGAWLIWKIIVTQQASVIFPSVLLDETEDVDSLGFTYYTPQLLEARGLEIAARRFKNIHSILFKTGRVRREDAVVDDDNPLPGPLNHLDHHIMMTRHSGGGRKHHRKALTYMINAFGDTNRDTKDTLKELILHDAWNATGIPSLIHHHCNSLTTISLAHRCVIWEGGWQLAKALAPALAQVKHLKQLTFSIREFADHGRPPSHPGSIEEDPDAEYRHDIADLLTRGCRWQHLRRIHLRGGFVGSVDAMDRLVEQAPNLEVLSLRAMGYAGVPVINHGGTTRSWDQNDLTTLKGLLVRLEELRSFQRLGLDEPIYNGAKQCSLKYKVSAMVDTFWRDEYIERPLDNPATDN